MTNETMIEALEYGLILEKTKKEFYLSCLHLSCRNCKFEDLSSCNFDITKENLKFLKENYPEHLLKV